MVRSVAVFVVFVALSIAKHACFSQPARTVMVHLFEWSWNDVAIECETRLGPKGYAAVQVSPPQEHVQGPQWWTRYQPVSYKIQSRSGNSAQFADMVARCKKVGVAIYVDAVINHMTGVGAGTGVAGSEYSPYSYPAVPFGPADFHRCSNPNSDIVGSDYGQNEKNVRECELVNLADLRTENEYVRSMIADTYLNELVRVGVSGFRIDASKHMYPADIKEIMNRVSGEPYVFQEVIGSPGEAVGVNEYLPVGDVTEFMYGRKLSEIFSQGQLKYLQTFGQGWGMVPSEKAVVFTNNHDNQRGHGGGSDVLTWRNGQLHTLASIFMLAWPYGYPKLMSSFTFTDTDEGPPSEPASDCKSRWVCEHRIASVENMVEFRNTASPAFNISYWWDNGNNAIAFSRGSRAFVIINRESRGIDVTIQTGMAEGEYCDVISGEVSATACTGSRIRISEAGIFSAYVGGMNAVAIHANARPFQTAQETPSPTGQSPGPSQTPDELQSESPSAVIEESSGFKSIFETVFIRGDFNEWGALPMVLSEDHTWSITVADLSGEFKFDIFGDWSKNYGVSGEPGKLRENGGNIQGLAGSSQVTFNDLAKSFVVKRYSL